jgi:hypothetical protein
MSTRFFNRPSAAYTGEVGLTNRDKYQQDFAAIPKRKIDPIKMDGDINYLLDAANTLYDTATTGLLPDGSVTNAKLRSSSALSVIGRSAGTSGVVADIAAANDGEVLRRSGSTLGFGQLASGAYGAGSVTTAAIADGAVTAIKIPDGSITPAKLSSGTASLVAKIQRFISLCSTNQTIGSGETAIDGASFSYTALSATNKLHIIIDLFSYITTGGEWKLRVKRNGALFDATMASADKVGVAVAGPSSRTICVTLTPSDTSAATYTVTAERMYGSGNLCVNNNNYHTALFIEEVA